MPIPKNTRDPELCAVGASRRWLKAARITEGPMFRGVNRWGQVSGSLSGHAIAGIVKAAAERAGLDPKQFAGESLRRLS